MEPWMPDAEKALFYKYLDQASNYFEFGSGGSTYQAAIRDNIKKIYSVESDQGWQKHLKENIKLPQEPLLNRSDDSDDTIVDQKSIRYIYVDMDTKPNNMGYPGDKSSLDDWRKYYLAMHNLTPDQISKIDLILIDGRFRVSCALRIFPLINSDAIICFDDFDRKYYHIVLDYYDIIEKTGRMVILKRKSYITPPGKYLLENYQSVSW